MSQSFDISLCDEIVSSLDYRRSQLGFSRSDLISVALDSYLESSNSPLRASVSCALARIGESDPSVFSTCYHLALAHYQTYAGDKSPSSSAAWAVDRWQQLVFESEVLAAGSLPL